ncbi:hypothetical protein ACFVFQ_31840 [Streptomyces sp. NPDC057743]
MSTSRVRINLTGKAPKPEAEPVKGQPQSRVRINLTGKHGKKS